MISRVVCRALGMFGGQAIKGAAYGEGAGPIWLTNVRCQGTESSLRACSADTASSSSCHHGQDAGVVCSRKLDINIIYVNLTELFKGNSDKCHCNSPSSMGMPHCTMLHSCICITYQPTRCAGVKLTSEKQSMA